jgi:hypothetical protein
MLSYLTRRAAVIERLIAFSGCVLVVIGCCDVQARNGGIERFIPAAHKEAAPPTEHRVRLTAGPRK